MVNMKGSTRLLDKVLADNGTASARTLEVYGVTSIDELLNVPMLVKSNIDGVDTATMKINTFDAKDIKIMKGTEKVSPYSQWVMSGQLYQLIYDGFQFVAYPFGVSGGNESNDYSVMKLDFNAFSTSTKDNLITKVGAETLGELLYNLEQNVDCDYIFVKNSSIETMNMPCVFSYHEYVSSLSLHTVMLSAFYNKTLYTFVIEYSYGTDDSLTIMDYNVSQISLVDSPIFWNTLTVDYAWTVEETVQYKKENNRVFLRGAIENGSEGSLIATLPEGVRPTRISRDVVYALIGSENVARSIAIYTDGKIKFEPEFSHAPAQTAIILYLDGASFPLD